VQHKIVDNLCKSMSRISKTPQLSVLLYLHILTKSFPMAARFKDVYIYVCVCVCVGVCVRARARACVCVSIKYNILLYSNVHFLVCIYLSV
jgi:hypothetical protein